MTRFTESTALIARMEAAGVAQALPAARARLAGTQQQLALQRKQYQELQEEEAKRSARVRRHSCPWAAWQAHAAPKSRPASSGCSCQPPGGLLRGAGGRAVLSLPCALESAPLKVCAGALPCQVAELDEGKWYPGEAASSFCCRPAGSRAARPCGLARLPPHHLRGRQAAWDNACGAPRALGRLVGRG